MKKDFNKWLKHNVEISTQEGIEDILADGIHLFRDGKYLRQEYDSYVVETEYSSTLIYEGDNFAEALYVFYNE